jgi:pyridoxine 5-phosphate synthase
MLAIGAGADGITAHLREDRRHIRDRDIARLKAEITKPLNLEMAATPEMLRVAVATRPHAACLVPERREERTTEGGLDAAGQRAQLTPLIAELKQAGIRVSLFIAAQLSQIEAALLVGAPVIELHTGAWCDALAENRTQDAEREWERIRESAKLARREGLEVHAGHGLNFNTAEVIAALPEVVELNIGHFLVGEAIYIGLASAIKTMRAAMDRGRR